MDFGWMQQELTQYYGYIDHGPDEIYFRSDVIRLEPTVKEILKRLDPALADCNIDAFDNWGETRDAVDHGLGILAAREACETKLARDIPALSDRTIGLMIEAAGHYASATDELAAMLRRCDLARYGNMSASADKTEMLTSALLGARDQAEKTGNWQAQRSLLDFICLVAEKAFRNQVFTPRWRDELERDLLADGYKLIWQVNCAPDDDIHVELLPTDAAPVPLAVEITALEAELIACGYTSVLSHYRQAVDGFTNHKYESANGDLRTALEDLVTRLAEDHAGYARQSRANQGNAAIQHLIHTGHLPDSEGGMLLHGLWKLSHTNGPHPGQSDADETRFRLQVITATARFLLKRLSTA